MKRLSNLNAYRKMHPVLGMGDVHGGYFEVWSPLQANKKLRVMASTGEGWDHVSVSLPHRIPTWSEMDYIKRMFFEPDEVVMQLHVEEDRHIDMMKYCLHLWRPQSEKEGVIPMPPEWMV